MATTKRATYKRFNGIDWDTIYFYTVSGQVQETDGKYFLRTSNTVNGKSFFDASGNPTSIVITGSQIKVADDDTETIASRIDTLTKQSSNISGDYTALNTKVGTLESAVNGLQSNVEGFNDELLQLGKDLESLENLYNTLLNNPDDTLNSITELVNYVNEHGEEVAGMVEDIAGLRSDLNSHSHAWSTITNKPTTIAGYGITDLHISNGLITIGSNSIRPITSLNGYATQSWVNDQIAAKPHREIYYSTSEPSGASAGDVLIQYNA